MDTFEMLKRLLSQNEFELLLPDQTGAKEKNTDKTDIRLVYQMNDTIESFLVFKEARMTGTYKEDYEGAIEASFYRDGDDYALVVRQEEEDCVVTILFKTLELETNLYNYGDIAHFGEKVMKICGNWNFVLRYYGINMSILVRLSAMRKNENSCS